MKRYQVLLMAFLFLLSCNNSQIPSDVIKPPVMQDIFWDLIRGDILAGEIIKKDSAKNIRSESFAITEKVFQIHHVNRDKFEKSIDFYSKHPELLKPIFDSLSAKQATRNFRRDIHGGRDSIEMEKIKARKNFPNFPTHINKKR
jgi:hypothetical protein